MFVGILLVIGLLFGIGLAYAQYQNVYQKKKIYWSNCLIEAVRHWIMDPKGVQILYCPAIWNDVFCPHWMWKGEQGKEFDFHPQKKGMLRFWEFFWHKGGIRERKSGTYRRFINIKIAEKYYGGKMP